MAAFVAAPAVGTSSFSGSKVAGFFKTGSLPSTAAVCPAVDTTTVAVKAGRVFEVTVVYPSKKKGVIRDQNKANFSNTYFTKLVPYDQWFDEQRVLQFTGGKILGVKLYAGKKYINTGLL